MTSFKAFSSQAAADAIGDRFEFLTPRRTDIERLIDSGQMLEITDDTQMSMFAMEGIIRAHRTRSCPDVHDIQREVESAYLRWLNTQSHKTCLGDSGLESLTVMHKSKAPGRTCLQSLRQLKNGGRVENDSIGCGTVMRLLPFALFAEYQPEMAYELAINTSLATHQGLEILPATEYWWACRKEVPYLPGPVTRYGAGWTAMSCVEIAVCAVGNSADYREMLLQSIAHPGDSDSTAAVAGALWGLHGLPGPSDSLLARIDVLPVLQSLCSEFDYLMERAYG